MKIIWKNVEDGQDNIIESWMSADDRRNLCMQQKGWKQTASDIWDCLRFSKNGQFRNCLGFLGDPARPVVAVMFGIEESGKTLNVYNIITNPKYRGKGIAKQALSDILSGDNFSLNNTHSKTKVCSLPNNIAIKNVLKSLNFSDPIFDGEYMVFEKHLKKDKENAQSK